MKIDKERRSTCLLLDEGELEIDIIETSTGHEINSNSLTAQLDSNRLQDEIMEHL